jgi:3-phosphoshikimate 1-carboxyvinyltransferase
MFFVGKDLQKSGNIFGEIGVTSDKSITHRAFMLSAICKGESYIKNPLMAEDCFNTLKAVGKMGVDFKILENGDVLIKGIGLNNFKKSEIDIDLGNSGTGIRLLTGLVAGQVGLSTVFTGDKSLIKRPMDRIINPLSKMGAEILSNNGKAPLKIIGQKLKGITYNSPVASAQIKSCLLLAGLSADSDTTVIEPAQSRNHTENLFEYLGINIKIKSNEITVSPLKKQLEGREIFVPSDISSASFFIVLGILSSKEGILIKNVGLNHTRIGILNVLKQMGADLKIENERKISGEIVGDIFVKKSKLKGIEISDKNLIPNIIDEIPIISVAAIFAEGKTIIKNANELRVKECDRISAIKNEFSKFGAKITECEDGLIIDGQEFLNFESEKVKAISYMDHRIAMCEVILGILGKGEVEIDDIDCINTSFPTFFDCLKNLGVEL